MKKFLLTLLTFLSVIRSQVQTLSQADYRSDFDTLASRLIGISPHIPVKKVL